jgi:hypothetical protein
LICRNAVAAPVDSLACAGWRRRPFDDINLLGTVIAVRPYCHTDHYWQVYFDTNEAIVRVCKAAGWPAPTPTNITKLLQTSLAVDTTAPPRRLEAAGALGS